MKLRCFAFIVQILYKSTFTPRGDWAYVMGVTSSHQIKSWHMIVHSIFIESHQESVHEGASQRHTSNILSESTSNKYILTWSPLSFSLSLGMDHHHHLQKPNPNSTHLTGNIDTWLDFEVEDYLVLDDGSEESFSSQNMASSDNVTGGFELASAGATSANSNMQVIIHTSWILLYLSLLLWNNIENIEQYYALSWALI